MTGLDLTKNHIIEIAVIVTDGSLQHTIVGPNMVIKCPDSELESMDEWCTKTHNESGLVKKIKEEGISMEEAENIVMDFLEKKCGLKSFHC